MTATLRSIALADLEHELATTRRVLERVPEDRFDWRPHAKSMSMGGLATHLANIPGWGVATLTLPGLDFATLPPPAALPNLGAVLAAYDAAHAQLRAALAEHGSDAELTTTWVGTRGDQVMLQLPRVALMRSFVISHMAHHRGQLSVYLRLCDVPVPAIYGPTADEPNS